MELFVFGQAIFQTWNVQDPQYRLDLVEVDIYSTVIFQINPTRRSTTCSAPHDKTKRVNLPLNVN